MYLLLRSTGIAIAIMSSFVGCAILFPDRSAPKSANYSIQPPADPWRSVPVGESPESIEALRADMAFENTRTGAILSLNSVCRKYTAASLEELSRNLVLGIREKKVIRERFFEVDGTRAKDTMLAGEVENAPVQIRTVVMKKNQCTYDFILVSTPERMESSEPAMDSFLASFKSEQ